MNPEKKWHEWATLIQQERPWTLNDVTKALLLEVKDQDMASVIWALMGNHSLEWLKTPMPNLGNRSIRSLLQTNEEKELIWKTLESMAAWM